MYQVTAQNFSDEHENKIHSDAMAQKYGFEGALVPGVAVYGHMTFPLVERHGVDWLGNSTTNLRLLKPAYHGDQLSITLNEASGRAKQENVICSARQTELANLQSTPLRGNQRALLPQQLDTEPKDPERVVMAWGNVVPQQPFRSWNWHISAEENQLYCEQIRDNQTLFQTYAHPHWLLSQANRALTREYLMPAWIHAGSQVHHYAALAVGDDVVVRVLPLEKWQRKGHEFIKIYVAYVRGQVVTTEIEHTAIFKVAD